MFEQIRQTHRPTNFYFILRVQRTPGITPKKTKSIYFNYTTDLSKIYQKANE